MDLQNTERNNERDRFDRTHDEERGFFERAGDEVRAWFGDEHAGMRRKIDDRIEDKRAREEAYSRSKNGFDEAQIGDLMTRNVITVFSDDTLQRAARLMAEGDCGVLPVVNRDGRLVGMITDRDIVMRMAGKDLNPRTARVDECMSDDVIACHANDSILDCMRTMSHHKIRRIPIVYDRDRVIGIISQGDLARYAGASPGQGERRAVAEMLCSVSEPTYSPRHSE